MLVEAGSRLIRYFDEVYQTAFSTILHENERWQFMTRRRFLLFFLFREHRASSRGAPKEKSKPTLNDKTLFNFHSFSVPRFFSVVLCSREKRKSRRVLELEGALRPSPLSTESQRERKRKKEKQSLRRKCSEKKKISLLEEVSM